jgi:phosphoribosyl-ATP pyrophosphohydrolase
MVMPTAVKDRPMTLDELFAVIESRRGGDPDASYTAKLLARGPDRIAKKLGEEAVEAVIAAVQRDREAFLGECGDLLYHLLVLWAALGVRPEEVWAELANRKGVSGLVEKAGRPKDG